MEKARTKNILLVDDEQFLLDLLAEQLGECDSRFCVLTAHNGRTALEVLESENVDLVVTDIRMPEMGGETLISRMKQSYPALPVIAMSGYLYPELEARLSALGVSQQIDKSSLSAGVLEKRILDSLHGGLR